MKVFLTFFCSLALAVSCASFDVDKNLGESGAGRKNKTNPHQDNAVLVFPDPEIVFIDRPVFIPPEEKTPKSPAAGRETVLESNKGIIKPSDYSHAAIVYVYNPDEVYEVFAQPLRVCDLVMEVNERISDIPYVSDSERWVIGAGVSYENGNPVQHVYIKPELYGISASLIINTDRRVYRIILRSYADVHMPLVRWLYNPGMPNNYIPSAQPQNTANASQETTFAGVDPRFLSFNYRVKYQKELPSVFENRKDVLNYRVMGNVIIIDKLIEKITVKIGRKEITVTKKRG